MTLKCERCGARPWPVTPEIRSNTVPVPEEDRKGFEFDLPGGVRRLPVPPNDQWRTYMPWAMWRDYAVALNREIAMRCREYGGPATQDEPPPGGMPVAARIARAA